ncbi:efflux RND transporter permease subunit [Zunongwangia profunda]|uniref:Hydrophobe/amphiphile efflux-1 family RND transporter n=1 Tax=Zunongwangia profunda TaxID=398743 RepID=A0A3D5J532_9FLAO|nr:efflux RND transporter permease subunit [Zunongwangia profunda]HCV82470.1 hydrophobe/amphiphile efflux-1 family RND transporter [Zunongwangia profunda]|tara:strand:- start:4068 stop:7235 length:3168 start_codon:yes stop_codon:yes gene_type:complete
MFKKIIKRPVLTLVITIILLLAGAASITSLPVERFPEIAPPSVSVQVYYPGGNAETVAKSVLLPIEEAINGTENMSYANSTATNSGRGRVTVYFKPGTDPDLAAVDIQNRISTITSMIPTEVSEAGISVTKRMKGSIMTINIYSDDPTYDETFLNAFTRINIRRELKRVDGLAEASILRQRDYAMRIWLNPQKMASYQLTPRDVYNQIKDQNFEAAPGKFGENSEELFEIIMKHDGRFSQPEDYENLVIKTKDETSLHLRDIARVEFGASNYTSENRLNGKPSVTIDIVQQNGANAMEIDSRIREILEEQSRLFPDDVHYEITYSVRNQIDESMSQVEHTLVEAFILVFLVVFIFLQDFRATLITAISIPASLLGTFFFLNIIGASMNVLSMFSLVLAIGIVVDDAIVVMEAIHEKMTHHKMPVKEAVSSAMDEITGAIISITVVIAAVFVPVGFLSGPVGVFYQEFAYTIIFAVLISAINALTLTPVLSKIFFGKKDRKKDKRGIARAISNYRQFRKAKVLRRKGFRKFDTFFDRFTQKYLNAVRWILNRKWVGLGALAVIIGLTVFLSKITPSGFIPTEDDNFLILSMKMPEGSSLHRTNVALRKADSILQQQPAVKGVNTVSGFNVVDNANSPSSGLAYVQLNPADDRGEIHEIQAVIKDLLSKLDEIPETDFNMYPRPTVQGFGNFDGVQFMLQDRADGDLGDFGQIVNEFMNTLNNQKEVENAFTSFNPNFPQYRLDIDYEKAKNMGVSVKDMMFTIQSYFGRVQPGDFNRFSRQYGVYMQSDIQFRESPESFNSIFVKNDEGEMVPVNTIVKLKQTYGPEVVNRYNLYNAAKINVTPAKGYSTGDVMNMIEDLTAKKLPATLSYEWTSMSLEEKNSGGDTIIVFIIIILLVYFILASQYESFLLPLAVMLSLPVGIFGVFTAINIAGIDNNIYVQIGIIMLIGLLAKNSILIVEFVAQKRRAGFTAFDAVIEASALRIRPIIMTSLAFTVGLVPLMFAEGSSAQGNHSVSIGTAGGMISGIVLGIFIIPVLAYVFQVLHDKMNLERYAE